MGKATWKHAVEHCADPERARRVLQALAEGPAAAALKAASSEQARILAALWAGSEALSAWLVAHPDVLAELTLEKLEHPRRPQGLQREVAAWFQPDLDASKESEALAVLRRFKQKELCRIAARDLARMADAVQTTLELSQLADACLDQVLQCCARRLSRRVGNPWHQEADGTWRRTAFAVIALGKWGGQELNYSSDVDLMFVYTEEGVVFKEAPTRRTKLGSGMTGHQFFQRLAESFLEEVTKATLDGALYRVDLRLRPEGDAGPLVRSLPSYESFYAQWGQTWERMMLIKARGAAGDRSLAGEFLESIQTFRFPRLLNERVIHEIAAMKRRTEIEVVKSGELDRNVKLGRGGIREIEFIAQTAQVLHAGRLPFLQGSQTLPTLQKSAQYNLLTQAEAESLTAAYLFFRDVEHRLQMDQNLQTHSIPDQPEFLSRLARLMGFRSARAFEAARRDHADKVRRIYDQQLQTDAAVAEPSLPRDLTGARETWLRLLDHHGFREPERCLKLLTEFIQGPGYVHVSVRTTELAWELVPKILAHCPRKDLRAADLDREGTGLIFSDPDRVLARLDGFVSAYGARAMLFETWAHNPAYFDLLLLLFDRSEFLAETAISTPDLIDDLVQSRRLNSRKTFVETLEDLRHGLKDKDQHLWLRRYYQAELMRVGLRSILGLANFEQNLAELSHLADACLQYALEVVCKRRRLQPHAVSIVGLGKLGGQEIIYGSDLDIVFVAPAGAANLPALQPVAAEVMDLLSRRTAMGIVFQTDARLRPDGEKGLLVNTLDAFEDYYRQRAQLWEIQALSRARPVAGDPALGEGFRALAVALTDFTPAQVQAGFPLAASGSKIKPSKSPAGRRTVASGRSRAPQQAQTRLGLAAYTPTWKQEIARMRARVEKERTPFGQDALAIKTGSGGLMDAEFIAQTVCLEHAWNEGNTLRALERMREQRLLPGEVAGKFIDAYRHLRRVEGILRRWSLEGETELPVEDAPFKRVAIRCGFLTPEAFRTALAAWRKTLRAVYQKIMEQ